MKCIKGFTIEDCFNFKRFSDYIYEYSELESYNSQSSPNICNKYCYKFHECYRYESSSVILYNRIFGSEQYKICHKFDIRCII